ncbi:winged helix-turn-helix transcriptional regulator [Halogeometricum limi]|uniref:Transcriptional regulator, HxlR family n=1 Tax=Halogeometricum limi TaxID=555875 RepID=A0A1I6G0W1_9EURY|nr:winged helix-turn-helix transcriptional regulator [Halogeometricum limi]SFR35825.1 transcriptional regulator, HxlR family [Halogeometricum limi]
MSHRDTSLRAVRDGATLVGKKWHPAVVYSLVVDGPAGFSELERRLDVSAKVLTETLSDLTDEGIVRRHEIQKRPLRVEYTPTASGRELANVLRDLGRWSERRRGDDAPVVVVVDDDPRLTELYASMLSECDVRVANDGRSGLAAVDDAVDVLLLDRKMPDVDGEHVARHVAAEYRDVRVALLSSARLDETVLSVPFDRYLRKPVTATDLAETVASLSTPRTDAARRYLSTLAKLAAFRGDTGGDAYRSLEEQRAALADELPDADALAAEAGLTVGE